MSACPKRTLKQSLCIFWRRGEGIGVLNKVHRMKDKDKLNLNRIIVSGKIQTTNDKTWLANSYITVMMV